MSITTLDGALAGMQPARHFAKGVSGTLVAGRPHSFWPVAGSPGAGAYDTTLNGATLSSTSTIPNGAIPHTNPVSGNAHLARFTGSALQAGVLMLCDRLWVNQLTVNSTTVQSITFPGLPARSADGTSNGDGVMLAIETSAAASATAAAIDTVAGTGFSYTNQAGTTARSANWIDTPSAAVTLAGAFFRIGLQAGDTGVRSVQAFRFSTAWTTGTINLVAYRPLAAIEIIGAGIPNAIDALTSGFPRLYDGTVPFLVFVPSTTTTTGVQGTYVESQG